MLVQLLMVTKKCKVSGGLAGQVERGIGLPKALLTVYSCTLVSGCFLMNLMIL
ncbi:MAG: hypothetical protein ACI93R_001495 [Flavobacteriales bacterium]|jgi:hypothetical protein